MTRIAFLLLCHKDPEGIIGLARQLVAAGDCVAIHFDARASHADYARLHAALAGQEGVVFTRRRIKCGWGEWSLVGATLEAAQSALAAFPDASHFYMISGDCMPIKSARYAHRLLQAEPADYIESVDFHTSGWIRTGMREDRLHYRHYFNERRHKRAFYASLELQRRLGLSRRPPEDLRIMIGSQWWCLRRATLEKVLAFCRERPDVVRFFRTTWIPDESFFQTLVRHLVPESEIRSRTLTFLMFTDYGMPVTFHNDHYDLLLSQGYLFARKISPGAAELKVRLGSLYASDRDDFTITDEGRALYAYLAGKGRVGQRVAPRFWEREASLGRERTLLILSSKKWHLGQEIAARIAGATGIPALGYLFNEADTPLPDLGGIETSVEKRTRHRRALLRLLYEVHGTDRLLICLDPGSFDLFEDFSADRAHCNILHLETRPDEAFLAGHARRLGLIGENSAPDMLQQLLPALRNDLRHEEERLREAGFAHFRTLGPGTSARAATVTLADYLGITQKAAAALGVSRLIRDE
ncbi:DUF5928 domain-containing protein [Alkalilacustris brevis]|uniref:DUF5928 domain-containing protein n=1 Tax=Alkalilacustris brevis TaxID=2026338 RepID=UPI000E0DE3A6|nr:DUF5928 domain-containing protein [Alkalilacustris brevis]